MLLGQTAKFLSWFKIPVNFKVVVDSSLLLILCHKPSCSEFLNYIPKLQVHMIQSLLAVMPTLPSKSHHPFLWAGWGQTSSTVQWGNAKFTWCSDPVRTKRGSNLCMDGFIMLTSIANAICAILLTLWYPDGVSYCLPQKKQSGSFFSGEKNPR